MSSSLAGILQIVLLVAALAACYKPLGDYIARIFTSEKHLAPERGLYRVMGIDPEADQRWGTYARSVLAFSLVSVLFLYLIERIQHWLPYSNGMANVNPVTAFNTAASFVTNTNWQNYSGESTMGYVTQMAGLAVQNFVSAGVGIAVVIALIRGFTRKRTDRLGNFWVDLTRVTFRLLVPISIIGAVILMATGVIDNFSSTHLIHTLAGGQPDPGWRPGGLAGGHQGAGQQRRWLLQRQLRAPVREPEPVQQLVRDLPAAGHPVRAAADLRQDGRRQPAGLPAGRGHGRAVAGRGGRHHLLRVAARGHRAAGRGRSDGGQGGRLRHPGVVPVRRVHHRDLDRGGQLVPRLVHRRSAAASRCST